MKKILLTCCALGALTVGAQAADVYRAPAARMVAPAPVSNISGVIGVYGVGVSESDDVYGPWYGIGGEAKVNWFLSPGFSLQLDVDAEGYYSTDSDTEDGINTAAIGAHLSWRNPGYLIGVFGTLANHGYMEFGQAMFGVEGQFYLGNITLYGQVAGVTGIQDTDGDDAYQGWYARAVARYFVTPNWKIDGEIGVLKGDQYTDCCSDTTTFWGLGTEYKFDNSPLSIFAKYQGMRSTYDDYYGTATTFKIGAKLYLNQPTLLSNDRSGATLDTMDKQILPFGWWH